MFLKLLCTGFTDLSPEELRLEYYSTRASGDLQGYVSVVSPADFPPNMFSFLSEKTSIKTSCILFNQDDIR